MRKLIILLLVVIAVIYLFPGIVESNSWAYPDRPERYSRYLVEEGDTLSEISVRFMPEADWRIAVNWIREANGLPKNYILQPGDEINVPDADGPLTEPFGQD